MNLQTRTFLTVLLSTALLVVMLSVGLKWSMDRGLVEYVNSKQKNTFGPVVKMLEELYERDGSWDEVRRNPDTYDELVRQLLPRDQKFGGGSLLPPGPRQGSRPETHRPPHPDSAPPPPVRDVAPPPRREAGRRSPLPAVAARLLAPDKSLIAGPKRPFEESIYIKLEARGKQVGWLAVPGADPLGEDFEIDVIKVVQQSLVILLAALFLLSLLVTTLLVRPLVTSLRQIADILHRFADKSYLNVEVPHRQDEMGQVYRDLRQLGETLSEAETMRQRWFANISHELRTPLTVMKSEVEAMQDGVRPINLEQIQIIADQLKQLHHLVDDLSDLANAEAGSLRFRKEVVDLSELIEQHASQWQVISDDAGLTFSLDVLADVLIWADVNRIQQILDNLVSNACKYTQSPGYMRVSLAVSGQAAILKVDDSAPGVSAADQARLFDYLYRVDSSGNRSAGGSGLGLGIVQRIVEGHEGTVQVQDSELGGLCVVIRFPLFVEEADEDAAKEDAVKEGAGKPGKAVDDKTKEDR